MLELRKRNVNLYSRCEDPPSAGLLEGIAMYNRGEYFECHEVLEDIWRAEEDPVRFLYQGILQIGVGFYHLRNANWRGATGLLEGGIEKVSRYRPVCMTIDTERLVREAQWCLDRLHELGARQLDGFEWECVPTIQFVCD